MKKKTILITIGVIALLLFLIPAVSPETFKDINKIPVIGGLLKIITDPITQISGSIQREIYVATHNGQSPPKEYVVATCDVTVRNPPLVDAEFSFAPTCQFYEPFDMFDKTCIQTPSLNTLAIPILQDEIQVRQYKIYGDSENPTNSILMDSQNAVITETTSKGFTFKNCVDMGVNSFEFRIISVDGATIDSAIYPLYFVELT